MTLFVSNAKIGMEIEAFGEELEAFCFFFSAEIASIIII